MSGPNEGSSTSGAANRNNNTAKSDEMSTTEAAEDQAPQQQQQQPQKAGATTLEEDDEFEDFPVEDWTQEDTEEPRGNSNLWEESWDDDDINEDFSAQLKQEMKKVEAGSR